MSDEAERVEYEAAVYLAFQTTEADAWKCLERSGIFVGALLGETLIEAVELHGNGVGDVTAVLANLKRALRALAARYTRPRDPRPW